MLLSACGGEEEGGETGAFCLPTPPDDPQALLSQPRKPLPGERGLQLGEAELGASAAPWREKS